MVKFCRNCGEELAAAEDKLCKSCGANAVKATTYCRYCGHPTNAQDTVCPTCGAAIKPIPSRDRSLFQGNPKLIKLGRILNLTIVVIVVALYVWFSIPPRMARQPLKAASNLVLSSTGYTSLPLISVKAFPPQIPILSYSPTIYFRVNDTQKLTIYAIYN